MDVTFRAPHGLPRLDAASNPFGGSRSGRDGHFTRLPRWIAGTGNDTRPNPVLSPLRQAELFDPDGTYVRQWIPELSELDNPRDIHQLWRNAKTLRGLAHAAPIVELGAARDRFRHARRLARSTWRTTR